MEDLGSYIGAEGRKVSVREVNGEPAAVVTMDRTYETSIDDLWNALTDPERIPRWFLPISGDLKEGGRYQLTGNAGGLIERCAPPSELDLTWEMQGMSWVRVRLSEVEGGTKLVLEHIAHVPPEFQGKFGPGAVGVGWELAMLGLARHLDTGAAVDPKGAQEWTASDAGKAFIRSSSKAWGEAAIAAGEDRAQAEAAADRTTGFYTGEG